MEQYKAYPEYKDSGVEWLGPLPVSWECKRLDGYFSERREKVSDKDYPALSVTKNGIVPQLDSAAKSDDGDNRKKVSKGDFVINSRSDRKGSSGLSNFDGSVSLINTVIAPKGILGEFVNFLLKSHPFQEEYYRYGKGIVADLWSTNYSEMKNINLPIPTEYEQEKISRFLNYEIVNVDKLIGKQQLLIELLKEKRQAVISHAITKGLNPDVKMKDSGVEWLGEIPEHWEVLRLKQLTRNIKAGPFGSALTKDMYVNNGYRVYGQEQVIPADFTIGDYFITQEKFNELQQYNVQPGDILISCVGTFGKIAIVPSEIESGIINPRLIRLRINGSVLPDFLVIVLRSNIIYEQFLFLSRGGTMEIINIGTLNTIMLSTPPIVEQSAIVTFLNHKISHIDATISGSENIIKLLKERRASLISAAVTGKIDVRDWQAPKEAA